MATWTSQRSGNWSDDAANPTSPWYGGGNPASGIPVSGDSVTIGAHTVTFDVDQTGFAVGLAALTINAGGTLQASSTPGAYVLKMAGNVTGKGVLRAGTSGTPYPIGCTFSILLNGNYRVNVTGADSLQIYDTEPTYKVIQLSADEAAGQTELSVDTDVTGDIWAAGDLIRIDDVAGTLPDSEERTIAAGGITATTITITAGLATAKAAGSKVILISRNIKIVGNGSGVTDKGIDSPTGGVARCEIRGCGYGVYAGSGHTISGTVSGCGYGVYTGSGHTISGTVSGCANGVYYGSGHTISGTVSGCGTGVSAGSGHTISGTVSGCTTGVNLGSGYALLSATFSSNTQDIYRVSEFRAHNTQFLGATEFSGYNNTERMPWSYAESFDHDAVAAAYKAWTLGGITIKQAVVVPPSGAWAYNLLPESATYPVFVQEVVMAQPLQWTYVNGWLRKDASMAYLPRLWLVLPTSDPLVDSAKTPEVERVMTDSVDTWEPFALAYYNSSTFPVRLVVRAVAKNATGNVYAYWRVARQPMVVAGS